MSEAFWSRTKRAENGCLMWIGRIAPDGYGRYYSGQSAHRCAYVFAKGPIPEGLEIDHLCGNRACVEPAHLEPVTHRENLLRSSSNFAAINAAKTHCPQGHPYDGKNTYRTPTGARSCRACNRARVRVPRATTSGRRQ